MTTVGAVPRTRRAERVAFGWGAAEAMLFFVIPDVFLTLLALRSGIRISWRAALWATVGAVVGGVAMFVWAAMDGSTVFSVVNLLPGIDTEMIETVRRRVGESGTVALVAGPWQGIPFKLYAAAAGELGLSVWSLIAWTVPGRLARFTLSIAVASYLRWFFSRWLSLRVLTTAWALFWLAVYTGYWFG